MTTATEQPAMDLRSLERIELQLIADNPWQPRTELDGIDELAADIRENGLLQAPMVRPVEQDGHTHYELAFGHRRLAAVRSLGWTSLQVEVKTLSDHRMAIVALSENTRRRDLKPMEEYRAWQKALEIEGMDVPALAAAMGLDRSTVANHLRILRLPQFVLQHVDAGELSSHGAREFLALMGGDGHFHEDEAKGVIAQLTTGAPDWRVARIRLLIQEELERARVADWRILFNTPIAHNAVTPAFDVAEFKKQNVDKVHTIPNDDWGAGVWRDGERQPGKMHKEGSREWTCATSAWSKAQTAGKSAAEGVAGAAAKKTDASSGPKTPGKTSKWPVTLSQDPVFKNVSPATDGPLMQTLSKDERNAQAAAQMGTRGEPGVFTKGGKQFQALLDVRADSWGWHDFKLTEVPSYFADKDECLNRCTTGAKYMQQDAKSPLYLACTNETCFAQHCSKGRQVIEQKVGKLVRDVDTRDDVLYDLLYSAATDGALTLPAPIAQLFAAVLMHAFSPKAVDPRTNDWKVDRELAVWPANVQQLAQAVGVEVDDLDDGEGVLTDENAIEVVLRAIVERSRHKDLQPFADALVKATTEPALPSTAAPVVQDGLSQE